MKFDANLGVTAPDLDAIRELAQRVEQAGYDAVWCSETGRDAFLPALLAAGATHELHVGTGIAVAFARNPMSLAMLGNDLQAFSNGRFALGLGSQVKAHIERRFSMPWSRPAARMRELVQAIRAIWRSWNQKERLRFEGEFYRHTLMTPYFSPPPNPFGEPPIHLAAVGPKMTEIAGEVADGVLLHSFKTDRYLREVSLPALERGIARAGRKRSDVSVSCPVFVATGPDEARLARSKESVREQIAFYASTPEYRPVLELHGWAGLQDELGALARKGAWSEMAARIDDAMLENFAVIAEPGKVLGEIERRFGDVADRVNLFDPTRTEPEAWADLLASRRG